MSRNEKLMRMRMKMYEKYAIYYQSYVFKFLSIKTCILFFPLIKIVNMVSKHNWLFLLDDAKKMTWIV